MTAQTFITRLENSNNKLLEAMSKDIMDWSKLRHNKECLELFLRYNIAVIRFNGEEFAVSSNLELLSELDKQRVVKNKNKIARVMATSPKYSKILKSKNMDIVRTWDLIKNNKLEVPMDTIWSIVFPKIIGINTNYIKPLAIEILDILNKGKLLK